MVASDLWWKNHFETWQEMVGRVVLISMLSCKDLLLSQLFYPLLGRTRLRCRCWAATRLSHRPKPSDSGVRRKFPREGKVSSQLCDITNQLWGKCRRHDHSKGVREQAPGKILQNYTWKYAFLCILEASFSIMVSRDL